MKASSSLTLLGWLATLAKSSSQESYIRQRQTQLEPENIATSYDGRQRAIVGDKLSTRIDKSESTQIRPIMSEDGHNLIYEINVRKDASYTTVHFKNFDMGDHCTMTVTGKDKQIYTLTGRGKMNLGEFWTQHVKGDTMVLEVSCDQEPNALESMSFEVDEVAVGFVEDIGRSICGTNDFRDAICFTQSNPTEYARARPVARLLIEGVVLCTGFLVGPNGHMLTNNHCLRTAREAANTDYEFGAEAPTCGADNCQLCHRGTIFSGAFYITGALIPYDWSLLQFTSSQPDETFGYLELDVRTATLGEQIYIPQHPRGRAKEFGITTTHTSNPSGLCRIDGINEQGCTGSDNNIGYYCDTELGSDGAPVLSSANHKVIGIHQCTGAIPCTQTGGDPNRGVPIVAISPDIDDIINVPRVPTTPAPTPVITPAPTNSCGSETLFFLDLVTDTWGIETLWSVENACTGQIVFRGGPYPRGVIARYSEQICLPSGQSYIFTIFDTFGDGICCIHGPGNYRIFYDGVLVGQGAEFGYQESHSFGATCPPTPAPTPRPPTQAPTKACACFSKASTVSVQNQGPTEMPNLAAGDKVLTGNGYQTVYAFAHQDNQTQTEFLQIYTEEDPNNPLEITGQHFVFVVGKPHAVPAHTIHPGDVLQSTQWPDGMVVAKVNSVYRNGIHAPLTRDGTLVVDGVVASCYVALQSNAGEFMELQGGISTGLSQHFFAHLSMTPVRMVCLGLSSGLCKSFDEDGLAYFAKIGFAAANWANSLSLPLQIALAPVYLLVMLILYALETVLGPRGALMMVLGLLVAVAQGRYTLATPRSSKETRKVKTG